MNGNPIDALIEQIMHRHHAASGTAVFLDPVILRALLEPALIEQRVLGHGDGQTHAIADVNAGLIDDLIRPRLDRDKAVTRYRMDITYVHHAMSGWGGEATVVPREDPAGEWTRVTP